jgi:hypothetical protein
VPSTDVLVCPECSREFGGQSRWGQLGNHRKKEHGVMSKAQMERQANDILAGVPRETSPEAPSENGAGEVYAERTPTEPKASAPKSGLLGKFWAGKEKEEKNGTVPRGTSPERRPAAPKRRTGTAAFWGDLVGPVSAVAARAGYVPMSRAMQWSSPVAGEIVEDATKGTLVDKLVQPVVRNSEKWQDLFDLLGFWAAVGVAQRNPAQAQTALGFARSRLVNLLPRIAANIKKERAKEREAVQALTELMPDIAELFPDAGPDDDPVSLLIESLFAMPGQPVPEPAHAA